MNQEVVNVLNQGAPIFRGIKINIYDLLLIADDQNKLLDNINKINKWFRSQTHYTSGIAFHHIGSVDKECIDAEVVEEDFIKDIYITASRTNSETKIYLDPTNYFERIQKILNMPVISSDYKDENIKNRIWDRINELDKINNLEDLKKEFPVLYIDYENGNKLWNEISLYELTDPNKYLRLKNKYFRCGLKFVPRLFIEKQVSIFRDLVNNFNKIVNICSRQYNKLKDSDNTDFLTGVNPDKLKFLIAYKYIELANNTKKLEDYQNAIFYIMPILSDNSNMKISFEYDDEILSYNYFKKVYQTISKSIKEITPYNTSRKKFIGKTMDESMKILDDELGLLSTKKYDRPLISIPRIITGASDPRLPKTDEELNAMYERKIKLLENDEYIEKFVTQYGYNWYIYFLYSNGNILRERYFRNFDTYLLAKEGAMYKSDIINYPEVKDKKNSVLMYYPSDVVDRIYHTKKYEEEARYYMTEQKDFINISDVEKFILEERKNGNLVPTRNRKMY